MKHYRKLKVYPKHVNRKNDWLKWVPEIRISGIWVRDAGFVTGDEVIVEVKKNLLIIKNGNVNKK